MADSTDPVSARRYQEKISIINGEDPYQIPAEKWSDGTHNVPNLTFGDIFTYLVCSTSYYTKEQFKAFKGLGAFNQAINGWVQSVKSYRPKDCNYVLLTGKILHSMKISEKPLQPWFICEPDGTVKAAHCNCMAGLAEACSHVAALMFYMELTARHQETVTATGLPCLWNRPSGSTNDISGPSRAGEIDFTSPKSQRKEILNNSDSACIRKPNTKMVMAEPTQEERDNFFKTIYNGGKETYPVVMSVLPNYSNLFVPYKDFPHTITSLKKQFHFKSVESLMTFCMSVNVSCSVEQSLLVERETRDQTSSKLWFRQREGRITASKLHSVCHTSVNKPSLSLLNSILHGQTFSSTATAWGSNHEDTARNAYRLKMEHLHERFECLTCGLFISSDYPFLAGTPDGLVNCACCCGKGCLEIKCPYSARNLTIKEAVSSVQNFCLSFADDHGNISLSTKHPYFFQVQCQMFVAGCDYVDFCVWTVKDLFVQRISFDKDFMSECIERASIFFRKALLPELFASHFSLNHEKKPLSPKKSQNSSQVYCFCQQTEFGRMIMCEADNCKVKWFHYPCVDIIRKPRGKWYCVTCKPTKITKKKAAKRKCEESKT